MLLSVMCVKCADCDTVSEAFDGAIYKPSEVRTELKQDGWTRRRARFETEDVCPTCSAKAANRKKAA